MTTTWTIHFVNKVAEEEILKLAPELQAKFLHISDLLISFGPHQIGLPHVRPLEKKLWELRLKGKDNIARSIYVLASQRRIIILHTFIKKTQKTPQKALEIARKRMKENSL
jgi:phage-related protein